MEGERELRPLPWQKHRAAMQRCEGRVGEIKFDKSPETGLERIAWSQKTSDYNYVYWAAGC